MRSKKYFNIKFNTVNRIILKKSSQKNNYIMLVLNSKKKILEKIGFFNFKKNQFSINIFRLIYWISKNYILYGKVLHLLTSNFILQLKKND